MKGHINRCFLCVTFMRKYYDDNKTYIEVFVDFSGFCYIILPVPMYVYALLTPERLDVLNLYSGFKSLSLTGRCLVSLNIPAPKLRTPQMSSKTKWRFFLKRPKPFLFNLFDFWIPPV